MISIHTFIFKRQVYVRMYWGNNSTMYRHYGLSVLCFLESYHCNNTIILYWYGYKYTSRNPWKYVSKISKVDVSTQNTNSSAKGFFTVTVVCVHFSVFHRNCNRTLFQSLESFMIVDYENKLEYEIIRRFCGDWNQTIFRSKNYYYYEMLE